MFRISCILAKASRNKLSSWIASFIQVLYWLRSLCWAEFDFSSDPYFSCNRFKLFKLFSFRRRSLSMAWIKPCIAVKRSYENKNNILKNGLFSESVIINVSCDGVFNVPELELLQLQQLMASFPKKCLCFCFQFSIKNLTLGMFGIKCQLAVVYSTKCSCRMRLAWDKWLRVYLCMFSQWFCGEYVLSKYWWLFLFFELFSRKWNFFTFSCCSNLNKTNFEYDKLIKF